VAKTTVSDPQGRLWTIREVWASPIRGLPPNAWADDTLGGVLPILVQLPLALIGLLFSLLRWLLEFPLALLRLSFFPPLIEAEPRWRAAREDDMEGAEPSERAGGDRADCGGIRDDRLRADVEGASFVRFD
jgi:hypothetical protein